MEVHSSTHVHGVMSELYQLYQDGICCDVILSTHDYQTSAHKIVLMASSEYFKSLLLDPDLKEDFIVLPPDVSGECLQSLMEFLYTGTLFLNSENIVFMLSGSTLLQIRSAVSLCHKYLSDVDCKLPVDDIPISLVTADREFPSEQDARVIVKEEIPGFDEALKYDFDPSNPLVNSKSSCKAKAKTPKKAKIVTTKKRKTNKSKLLDDEKTKSVGKKTNKKSNVKSLRKKRKAKKRAKKQRKIEKPDVVDSDEPTFSAEEQSPTVKEEEERSAVHEPIKIRIFSKTRKLSFSSFVKSSFPLRRVLLAQGTDYACHLCGRGFARRAGLVVHHRFFHSMPSPSAAYRCYKHLLVRSLNVKMRFGISNKLSSIHSKNSARRKTSDEFRRRLRQTSSLSRRWKGIKGDVKPYVKRTKTRSGGTRPFKPTFRYRCPTCGQPFLYQSNVKSHHRAYHKKRVYRRTLSTYQKRMLKTTMCVCGEGDCGETFATLGELKKHMDVNHPTVLFSCPDCRFTSPVEKIILRHRDQRHVRKKIMCDLCGKSCLKLFRLKQHMFIHHNVKDPSLKLFQCAYEGCSYECCSKTALTNHCIRHTLSKSLSCVDCGKTFKHNAGLERHVNTIHRGIRPFICDQCGAGFGLEGELRTHVSRHSKVKRYACDHCTYRAHDKVNLKTHMYRRHKIVPTRRREKLPMTFRCERCEFSTDRRGRLTDHMKKHENIRDIKCPKCDKLFITKKNLYGHTVTVHRPKTLQCTFCNYSTALLSALKDHVRIVHTHRHEKRYECPVCGFRSATGGNCRKHIQGTHKEFVIQPRFVGVRRTRAMADDENELEEAERERPSDEGERNVGEECEIQPIFVVASKRENAAGNENERNLRELTMDLNEPRESNSNIIPRMYIT